MSAMQVATIVRVCTSTGAAVVRNSKLRIDTPSCIRNSFWPLRLVGFVDLPLCYRTFSSLYGPAKRRDRKKPLINFETIPRSNPDAAPATSLLQLSQLNPYSNNTLQRDFIKAPKVELYQGPCVRALSCRWIPRSGRDINGRITVRHRGGYRARRLRFVDFKRGRKEIWATVLRLEYDPIRTCNIALIQYEDGVLSYVIAPYNVLQGSRIIASENAPIEPGNCLPLRKIPASTMICSLEAFPGSGGKYIRASGCTAKIHVIEEHFAVIELPSGELRKFSLDCWATVGRVGIGSKRKVCQKAGHNRWRGIRPRVRGTAMNKHKHPHGGNGSHPTKGKPPKTKWGKPALNYKTRAPRKPWGLILQQRFKKSAKNTEAFVQSVKKAVTKTA